MLCVCVVYVCGRGLDRLGEVEVENHKYKGSDGGILNYSNPIKCCNILQSRETPTWEENIRNSRTGVVNLVSKV